MTIQQLSTPGFHETWHRYILRISNDPNMTKERLLKHLREHVDQHMPDENDHPERWLQWLAGTYNLLAILQAMYGVSPSYQLGLSRLFQKWRQHPFDHTRPPTGETEFIREWMNVPWTGTETGRASSSRPNVEEK